MTAPLAALATQKRLSLAIVVYVVLSVAGYAYVSHVFGVGAASCLSLIVVLPLAVALRMRMRRQVPRVREVTFLFTLVIVVCAATVGVIWNWYRTGMDLRHADDVSYAKLSRLVGDDPGFRNVELFVSGKHIFWMRGTVASKADLARLRRLAAESGIPWNDEVELRDGQSR